MVALTGVVVLAVLAAGWLLLVSPQRAEAADAARADRGPAATANATLRDQAALAPQAEDLPAQRAQLAAVPRKIPDNPALPALLRALTGQRRDAGVELARRAGAGRRLAVAAAAPAAAEPGRGRRRPAAGARRRPGRHAPPSRR